MSAMLDEYKEQLNKFNWESTRLLDGLDDIYEKPKVEALYKQAFDYILTLPEDKSLYGYQEYYIIPCIRRMCNIMKDHKTMRSNLNDSIAWSQFDKFIDVKDLYSYLSYTLEMTIHGLYHLKAIDYESEAVALVCHNYTNMLFDAIRTSGGVQKYYDIVIKSKHRDYAINKLTDDI